MTFGEQDIGRHNQMLGQKIEHPPSTNFNYDTTEPAAKRIKRNQSIDASLPRDDSEGERWMKPSRTEIPDSEDEADEEPLPIGSQTELESALPPVKTDKAAIADYEATRHADSVALRERVGQGKWTKGQSSIYVDAFNLALQTVLEDESHLFDEPELAVFESWSSLSYESQYLYVCS